MPTLLVIDEPVEQVETWRATLEDAGYELVVSAPDTAVRMPATAPDAIVLATPGPDARAWSLFETLRRPGAGTARVPVLAIVGADAIEDGLRARIEGAVRCLTEPVDPGTLSAALDAVLGALAPAPTEQRRQSRQRALAVLARIEARGAAADEEAPHPGVHLTRLEHAPGRAPEADPYAEVRRRVAHLTPKQRVLLGLVRDEGGVTAVAAKLGTSRGNVYAGLRRIVHRLGVRDTAELLRIVASGDLVPGART